MTLNGGSDWASLASSLLDLIFQLLPVQHWTPFAAVCNHWCCTAMESFRQPSRQLPLLLHRVDKEEARWSLYSVNTQTTVGRFQLRWPSKDRFYGCSCGWLILFNSEAAEVSLYNPFSGRTIRLVVLDRLCDQPWWCEYCMKGELSGSPDADGSFALLVIYGFERKLAFIRSGDCQWTYIDGHESWKGMEDVTYSNGMFFALGYAGHDLLCIEANTGSVVKKLSGGPTRLWRWGTFYLVKSWENGKEHVFMVSKICASNILETRFQIHKLDEDGRGSVEWVEVESLGDVSLFLGNRHCISLVASTCKGCRPNSIYFYTINRIGVFNLGDGSISTLKDGELPYDLTIHPWPTDTPVWIVPKFI